MFTRNIGIVNQRIFPASGLQYYWRFDEGSGTSISDAKNTLSGSLSDAAMWVASGKNKSAIRAQNRYFYTDAWTRWSTTQPYTINFWVNTDNTTAVVQCLTNVNSSTQSIIDIYFNSKNIYVSILNGSARCAIRCDSLITDSNWHMITCTYNGDRNPSNMLVWKDSATVTPTVTNNNLNADATLGLEYLQIGRRITTLYNVTAIHDEVGVWNRVLTQEEVTALYNLGTGIYY